MASQKSSDDLVELLSQSSLSSEILEIRVRQGSSEQQFFIHAAIIYEISDYFRNVLKGSWKESKTHKFHLLDYIPDAFRLYSTWLYAKSTNKSVPSNVQVPKEYEARSSPAAFRNLLFDAYLLGEFVQDLPFLDAVMDRLVALGVEDSEGKFPNVEEVRYVCERSVSSSKLRQALVKVYVEQAGNGWEFEDRDGPLLADFLAKVLEGIVKKRRSTRGELIAADYHQAGLAKKQKLESSQDGDKK